MQRDRNRTRLTLGAAALTALAGGATGCRTLQAVRPAPEPPVAATSENPAPEPGTGDLLRDRWDRSASGWDFIDPASLADGVSLPPESTGAGLEGQDAAARLYADVMSLPLPVEAAAPAQGQQTTNIQQASFSEVGSDFDPQVSRDGKRVVFASTRHRPTADIYVQGVGSRVVTRLTDDPAQDVMPALSPDGRRIAFASNRSGNWDIYVMPSTGGRALQITSDATHDLHPTWSPDGKYLAFSRLGQTSGRWELWVADVFNPASLTFIGYGLFPEWCPVPNTGLSGGDRILFQRSRERGERSFSVWTIDYDPRVQQAGNETEIVSSPVAALINPSWSPDGQRIVYSAVPNNGAWRSGRAPRPETASIWTIGVDGRGEVELTRGNAVDLMPTWSSTGNVFFVSDRSGAENLWSLDIAPAIHAASGVDPRADERGRSVATVPTEGD